MLETSNGNLALHETFRNRLVYNQRFLKMSVVTLLLSPSLGRGTPEGQGVGRRRNRAKPTSGAARHLLPKEGGRNRSKCSALYTPSLKAVYSYSLFMNLHNLILRLNQRFLPLRFPENRWLSQALRFHHDGSTVSPSSSAISRISFSLHFVACRIKDSGICISRSCMTNALVSSLRPSSRPFSRPFVIPAATP